MHTRREILRMLGMGVVTLPFRRRYSTPRLPHALKQGMTIGIVAPAGPVQLRQLRPGIEFFESLGMRVILGKRLYSGGAEYLAATDRERASELMEFLLRPDIDAVICARGGYGVLRILPLLDFNALLDCRKPVVGYSDITALLLALYQRTGLVTFHGPMATSQFDATTAGSFLATLFHFEQEHVGPAEVQLSYSSDTMQAIGIGSAEGVLLGGNLSVFCSLLATPFEPDTSGCILFFEDVGEEPYKVDRMFTQLALAGKFDDIRGMVLGAFTKQSSTARESDTPQTGSSITTIAAEYCALKNIPLITNFPTGHITAKVTLPIGIRARIETDPPTLRILEAPVQSAS
ncbi:MAG: LD-carboxypeptidase [Chlorobi bacterium]|nr:LD-carboxypeptidase [Chlorobiota bacterium]